jgi:ribosomal 30S subunit maturation factor RimM
MVSTVNGTVLVPYRAEIVERVDVEAKTVVVKSSVGLFD